MLPAEVDKTVSGRHANDPVARCSLVKHRIEKETERELSGKRRGTASQQAVDTLIERVSFNSRK